MNFPSSTRLFVLLLALPMTALAAGIAPLPDDPACTAEDRKFMNRAIELAAAANAHGNGAYGAVLVKDGKILLEFEAQSTTSGDVTKHAETGLISLASRKFSAAEVQGAILYTSTEPCIMCCGAISFYGLKKFVYGVTATQVARLRGSRVPENPLSCREVFTRRVPADVKVLGPLLEAEGLAVHAVAIAKLK